MGLIYLVVFGFVGLSAVYVLVAVYSRSVRRERLEKHWDAHPPEGADADDRRAYIEAGMAAYHRGFRRKLIVLVYIIPVIAVAVIIFLTNAN